jgi:chromosome segregation ATPase
MSKLSELFGQRDGDTTNSIAALLSDPPSAPVSDTTNTQQAAARPADSRPAEAQVAGGAKIGEENEALRNLLVDAGMKIRQFDDYKNIFINLIEPATQALRTLEHEKTSNIDLRRKLEQSVVRCDEFRARTHELETRHAILIGENEKLRQELDLSRQAARDAERSRAEFANENLIKRSAIADLERQLSLETARVNTLSDDNQRLRDETVAAEARANRAAAETSTARDKISFLEDEVASVQRALDQVSEQAAHAARRFTDSETALTATKAKLAQLENGYGEVQTERDRLRAALDEMSARHSNEQSRTEMQIDAVRARAATAEKLLNEARRLLTLRGEEARSAEQRAAEVAYVQEKLEKKVAELETDLAEQETEINELKTARDRLIEKSTVVVNTLKLRETQLARAEDLARSATERAARLEAEAKESGEAFERRIEQLVTTLERERLDNEVTEGALDAARREREQMQSDLLRLQMEANRLAVNDDIDDMQFPSKGANAA